MTPAHFSARFLCLDRSATLQEIKVAYKNFALKLHPDVTGMKGGIEGGGTIGDALNRTSTVSGLVKGRDSFNLLRDEGNDMAGTLIPGIFPSFNLLIAFRRSWLPGNNEDKTRIFKQLTEAYNILSDQDARQKYDSKLGISRVSTFYRPGGSHPGGEGDIRAPRPPPDFKIFDHDEWNAWHYGEGEGVHKEPFVKRYGGMAMNWVGKKKRVEM